MEDLEFIIEGAGTTIPAETEDPTGWECVVFVLADLEEAE